MGKTKEAAGCAYGCVTLIAFLAIKVTFGALCFAFCLDTILGKAIPWYGDMICGLVLGQFVIPGAIVCLVLKWCGIPTPFIQ